MIKQSILKRPTTAYLTVTDDTNNSDISSQQNGLSLKFSPANSNNTASQKAVRFTGIDNHQKNQSTTPVPAPRAQVRQQRQQSCYPQIETNREDYFEIEKTQFPNEVGIKKYYKKSKTVPCKQIKLVGLNDEFIVASQPIQRHIQRELIQQQQQQQRATSSTKNRSQLRTTSARPFSDNHNRSIMYPNVFRVAPNTNSSAQTSKLHQPSFTHYSNNNSNNSFYEQTSSYQNSPHRSQHSYYHWQGSEVTPIKSPSENSSTANAANSFIMNNNNNNHNNHSQANSNSLNQQHNKILNYTSSQSPGNIHTSNNIKSSLVKLSSKKNKNKSNLNALFSPTSSMQSYGTYQTISLSNTSDHGADTSYTSNGTLNGSASQFSAQSHQNQQHQNQIYNPVQIQSAQTPKNPSSLTLYTYLLESNKSASKETTKQNKLRSQSKKFNHDAVYMKNLVPKIQKLDLKSQTNASTNSGITASIRQSINPLHESPSVYNNKINYKIFADNTSR